MSFWVDGAPWLVRLATPADLPAIHEHLRMHYGDPPRTAVYSPRVIESAIYLLAEGGCIRYRYVSHVEGTPIHVVDCFCVHPAARKRGCAAALLSALRDYATPRGMPCAVFLKEGRPLPIAPLISGTYYYRIRARSAVSPYLRRCPTALAHRLVAVQQSVVPSLILLDRTAPQEWWLYDAPQSGALVCIQDTEQRLPSGEKMVWFTGWIPFRGSEEEARNAVADQYEAVWFPAFEWRDPTWTADGAFHWYAFQWDTGLRVNPRGYVMVT